MSDACHPGAEGRRISPSKSKRSLGALGMTGGGYTLGMTG